SGPKISRRMHLRSFTNRHPEPSFILHWRCDFSSYKRNAVLMTMQKAKVTLARQRHRTARDNRFGTPLANRLTLPYWRSKGEALQWLHRRRFRAGDPRCRGEISNRQPAKCNRKSIARHTTVTSLTAG